MALSAATVWEVRTAGSDTACSGGFVTGQSGTDYSQQDAAQYTGTNLVIDGALNTKVTSATHNFVAADVGNLIRVTAGTNFTVGFYQIVSCASNAATLDRAVGTIGSTGGTFAVGGALATPGLAVAALVAGHTIYAKGSYTTTTNTANVTGGRLDFAVSGTQVAFNKFYGYTTTRGDGGKYTITLGATFTGPLITTNNANSFHDIRNVALVGNATSGSIAITHAGRSNRIQNLKVSGFGAGGGHIVQIVTGSATLADFEISGGATGTSAALALGVNCQVWNGWVHGNAGRGIVLSSGSMSMQRVISTDHTGANGYGFFNVSAGEWTTDHCVGWNNAAGDWILSGANGSIVCTYCVSGGGSGYNWDNLTGPNSIDLYYCARKQNTTGTFRTTPTINVGLVTLTGDPFTNAAAGDFSSDLVAGEGLALRDVVSTMFGLTTSYADIGAAQHLDAGINRLLLEDG